MNAQLIDQTIDQAFDELLVTHDLSVDHLQELVARRARPSEARVRKARRPGAVRLAIAVIALLVGLAGAAVAADDALNLGIFDRPSTKEPTPRVEESVDTLDAAVQNMPATFGSLGSLDNGSRRVALSSESDDLDVEIIVTRTTRGGYCLSALYSTDEHPSPGGGGGCFATLGSDWATATSFRSGFHGRDVAYGLMPDGVDEVVIDTSSGAHEATLGTNAYFWIAPDPQTRFEALRVTYGSGDQE